MSPVARRYAEALHQQADAAGQAAAVEADMAFVGETLAGSRELSSALASPAVSPAKKQAVLARLFADHVQSLTARFLNLLVEKQREDVVADIAAAYRALVDERSGTVEALVRTAHPLTPDAADRLQAALAARTGKKVRLRLQIEPDLIGGLVVRIGDVVYDRSVRHQLTQLRDGLAEAAAVRLN